MKKQKLTLIATLLSLASLASCGGKPSASVNPSEGGQEQGEKEITADEAATLINGYKSSTLSGKFAFSYDAKYKVDVDNHGGSATLDSFKHDIDDHTEGQVDLTAGNVYLKVTKTAKDLKAGTDSKKSEALVYKDGETYYYVTTTMENPVALADEAAALSKVSDLIYSVSYNLGGYVTRDTFKYEGEHKYEWREFGLSSTAVEPDYLNDPYYYGKLADGGLNIKYKAEYVGYKTDSGISDFSNKTDNYAAEAQIKTNKDGFVTSYAETYNTASLDFPIRTPAPTVQITGTRSFSASYGASFDKVATIDHQLTLAKITWDESNYGDFAVYTCTAADKANKTLIQSGDDVKVGDLLAVKVVPAGSNTIKAVTLGTTTVEADADGYYYFEITEGAKKLAVNFVGTDIKETSAWAVVTKELGEHVKSFKVQYRTYPDTKTYYELDELNRAPVGAANFLVLTAEFDEGYELDAFTVNGNATSNYGAWCYSIKEAGSYACKVTAKAVGDETPSNDVVFTIAKDAGVKSVAVSTRDGYNPNTLADVTEAGKAEAKAGRLFCLQIALNEGYQLDLVTAKNTVAGFRNGYYYFSLEKGTYEFSVATRPATETINYVEFSVTKDDGVASVSVFALDNFNFAGRLDYTQAKKAEAKAGRYLCLKVVTKDGYAVDSVKAGETDGNLQSGYYCFDGTKAGQVSYTVVTKTAA